MSDIIPLDTTEKDVARRTQEERERDKVLIARMYVRGKSQHEMVSALNQIYEDRRITPKVVHLDLQDIRQAWLSSTLVTLTPVSRRTGSLGEMGLGVVAGSRKINTSDWNMMGTMKSLCG
jgi:hypothetical protein